MLSQVGSKDGKITLEGFGKDYKSDPFAAFAGVAKLTGDETDIFGQKIKGDTDDEDKRDTFRLFGDDDDDDNLFSSYKKTKSGQDILDEYTKGFSFGSFF